jgi:putative membrane protein
MNLLIRWLIISLIILAAAYVFPGIKVASIYVALVAAIVLGLINLIIKPILVILTFPINILTLGLFSLILNALLIILASKLVPGFYVASFWWALLLGFILSIVNSATKKS